MKNTIRVSGKNKPEPKTPQGKKPSIHGQKTATLGQILSMAKALGHGDSAILAARAIGLNDDQLKSIVVLAEWEGHSPQEYLKRAINAILSASVCDVNIQAQHGKTGGEKESALKILTMLKLPIPVAETAAEKSRADGGDGLQLLENAIRQSKALDLLLLNSLESECVSLFRADRSYLAAGVMSLMNHAKHDLEMAHDVLRDAKN